MMYKSSSFDSALEKAMSIQQNTEGQVLSTLGTINQPIDDNGIADFNAGVDRMFMHTNKHITPK